MTSIISKPDLLLGLTAALIIDIYLIPILLNTGLYDSLPVAPPFLFISLPVLAVLGLIIAKYLAEKVTAFWQISKFGLVGLVNTAIDFGILNFLIAVTQVTSGVGIIFINATSFSTALINSYFWNKEWVFGKNQKKDKGYFLTFATVTLIGLSINTAVVYILTTYVTPIIFASGELWANFSKVLATLFSLTWNFLAYKRIVFAGKTASLENLKRVIFKK